MAHEMDGTVQFVLSIEEYESVRRDANQFVVLADHFTPEVEELVLETDGYWVVRKSGEAGEYVEQRDPRALSS